jgi:hypothetical protein
MEKSKGNTGDEISTEKRTQKIEDGLCEEIRRKGANFVAGVDANARAQGSPGL